MPILETWDDVQAEITPYWEFTVRSNFDLFDLTLRERQVAMLLFAESTNADIARALGIGDRTVKTHLTSMMSRTGTRSRLGVVLALLGVLVRKPV